MRFSSYSKYKPSGIEWLGDVPDQWETKSLRYVCRFAYGDSLAAEDREDGSVAVFGSNGAVGSHVTANTQEPVIVVGRKGSHGKVNFSEQKVFAIDTTYFVDHHQTKANLRWVYYALSTVGLDAVSKDSAVPGLAREDAYTHYLATPPMDEQRAIADFLDREAAKLDTLMEKKHALIEKLKEKRAALISRTVTRGLPPAAARAAGFNPHPKLKPSGIEWIGDVPVHWGVKNVKHVATIGNGSTPHRDNAEYWEDGSYPWLNSSVVNQVRVTEAEQFVTEMALAQCHLPRISPPAVLVGITGEGKTRGMATTLCIEATINQHLAYIKPKGALADVGYIHRVFECAYQYLRNESDGGGSTKGAITCEQITNLNLPVPSFQEQRAIADFLDRETARIDRLIEKVEAAIARLREYRGALITAAVTGKIDVRGRLPAGADSAILESVT